MGNSTVIRLNLREHLVLVRSVVSLLEIGFPLPRAFAATAAAERITRPTRAARRIHQQLSNGQSLGQAIRSTVRHADSMLLAMAEASDQSGATSHLLAQAEHHLEARLRLVQSATTAAIYPLFVLALTMAGAVLLQTTVMPQITGAFLAGLLSPEAAARYAESGDRFLTAAVASALVATALPALAMTLLAAAPEDSGVRTALDRMRLRLPVAGRLSSAWNLCAVTQASAAMTGAGLPLVRALEKAATCCGNQWIRCKTRRAVEEIRRGRPPADALRMLFTRHQKITHWLDQMKAGSDTGRVLASIAAALNGEISKAFERLQILTEPLLVVLAGGVLISAVVFVVRPLFLLLEQVMP